jgi:hypothetical protein
MFEDGPILAATDPHPMAAAFALAISAETITGISSITDGNSLEIVDRCMAERGHAILSDIGRG